MKNLQNKICLMGFMGSGKTTIGEILSLRLGLSFVDMDEVIESVQGMEINEIFSTYGEEKFRNLETRVLKGLLHKPVQFILALGGGTPCSETNLKLLQPHFNIYLKTSVEELTERLLNNRSERPLLKDLTPAELQKYIQEKTRTRAEYYENANLIIENSGGPVYVADEIVRSLRLAGFLSDSG